MTFNIIKLVKSERFSKDGRDYILFIHDGIRELYDITDHTTLTELEDVKKLGKFIILDYNGNHPNPPPLIPPKVSETCPFCKTNLKELENKLIEKELELMQREKELDEEIKRLKNK
jgi:hypothetical protein